MDDLDVLVDLVQKVIVQVSTYNMVNRPIMTMDIECISMTCE